jgi:NADPH2:quinone reductase
VKAVRIHKTGGPEVLQYEDVDLPPPAADQVRVKHTVIGVNFIDTYHRQGLYTLPMPAGIGSEAAGVVDAVGENVRGLKVGDRVVYCQVRGAYAEAQNIPAWLAVKLPDNISDEIAAAALLKGLTARYLLKATFPVKAGQPSSSTRQRGCRPDRLPMGEAFRRHGDRDRWIGRQGSSRP